MDLKETVRIAKHSEISQNIAVYFQMVGSFRDSHQHAISLFRSGHDKLLHCHNKVNWIYYETPGVTA